MMAIGHNRADVTAGKPRPCSLRSALPIKADSNVSELSVGQKQRVSIARALRSQP